MRKTARPHKKGRAKRWAPKSAAFLTYTVMSQLDSTDTTSDAIVVEDGTKRTWLLPPQTRQTSPTGYRVFERGETYTTIYDPAQSPRWRTTPKDMEIGEVRDLFHGLDAKFFRNRLREWSVAFHREDYHSLHNGSTNPRRRRIKIHPNTANNPGKLRETLLHEMCHAVAESRVPRGHMAGHGRRWKQEMFRLARKGEEWAREDAERYISSEELIHLCHDERLDALYQLIPTGTIPTIETIVSQIRALRDWGSFTDHIYEFPRSKDRRAAVSLLAMWNEIRRKRGNDDPIFHLWWGNVDRGPSGSLRREE